MLLSLAAELLSHGGVQRLGGHMVLAQKRLCAQWDVPLTVWSLNDPEGPQEITIAGERIPFTGFGRNRRSLLIEAARLAPRLRLAYLHHPYLAPVGLAMKLRSPALKYQVHIHGIDVWTPLTLVRQAALARAQIVTSTSRYTADRMLQEQRLKPRRIEVLYPTLDPDFESVAVEEDIAALPADIAALAKAPFVFTVSRLSRTEFYKGIEQAVRAFAKVAPEFPEARYLLVGDGDDRQRLQDVAATMPPDVAQRIHFLGRQPDSVLRALYRLCQVFMLPSTKEGFGIVFLEAMIHGKPCIAGNSGGSPEVVGDGENGLLVPYNDIARQAQALRTLLQNEDLRRAYGEASLRRLKEEFAFPHFQAVMEKVLREGGLGTPISRSASERFTGS